MKIIVIDANVWVSAYLFGGSPKAAVNHAIRHGRVYMTLACLEEIYKTLQKPKFRPKLLETRQTPEGILQKVIRTVVFLSSPQEPIPLDPALRDPDDRIILACAHAAKADLILTGDKDLLTLHPHKVFQILTPAQYLKQEHP